MKKNDKMEKRQKRSVTRYIYSATGEKLRVVHLTAVPNITVAMGQTRELAPSEILAADSTDYLLGGSLTMKNGRIDRFLFDEGYCQAVPSAINASQDYFTFYYFDRDHLGSVRQVILANGTNKGTLMQKMDYYPSGLLFCDGNSDGDVQPVRFSGKELDRMHGLGTYDFGARQYNPVTARWDRMDPLCEKYYDISPYAYCGNNPMKYIDPDGRIIRDSSGQIVYVSSGLITQVSHPSGSKGKLEIGYIFTDNGQPIQVFNNIGNADKGWDTDCHGFTFAEGKYWINNNQVENILKGDNYSIVNLEQARSGDIVVYYENEEVVHSVTIVNSNGTQSGTIVNGLGGLETEAHHDTLPNGWPSNGDVQFGVYRKVQADRMASEEEIEELQEIITKNENNQ